MEPPVMLTFAEVSVPMVAVLEFTFVPEALVKERAVVVTPVPVANVKVSP